MDYPNDPCINRVLLISPEVVAERMAGPAIRYWEMARALSDSVKVTLAMPGKPALRSERFCQESYEEDNHRALARLVEEADVVVASGYLLYKFPFLRSIPKPLAIDLYDPFILENLEIHSTRSMRAQRAIHQIDLQVLNDLLQRGDFFFCASEKQRDFWLGMLAANGRINPHTYLGDRTLRRLIDVIPFGLPPDPPKHWRRVLRGVHSNITPQDRIILWGGGIWEWFDPLTAIRAVAKVIESRPGVKLFFMGTRHPNVEDVPPMRRCAQAIELARNLDLYGSHVFFNDWVPYEDRGNYLLESDIGISLHFDCLETRLAFRTRILDYIWAGLPIVTTKGDAMSQLVQQYSLGKVVDYEDVEQVAAALLELLSVPNLRETYRARFEEVARQWRWDRIIHPLEEFCQHPWFAADRHFRPRAEIRPPLTPWWLLPAQARRALQRGGLKVLLRGARSYLRRRFGSFTRSLKHDKEGMGEPEQHGGGQ